ncbi:MAG: gluconate 2-dehydrogenase subunit 3 family protein [Rudanella sp.]|nr:gluconate 2-dehydrogenase subunit 3 family protein [Rudanella sp.]
MENTSLSGSVLDLINSDHVTPATRNALQNRLNQPPITEPKFFDEKQFKRLQLTCNQLIIRLNKEPIDIAGPIDIRLANGITNGWRYDDLPNDGEAYRLFLTGINQTAEALFDHSFETITTEQRDAVLRAVQQGEATGPAWQNLPTDRFFEELLTEVTEVYYSHPLAQQQIGYTGMADQ